MSVRMVLSSDDGNIVFNDNAPNSFQVQLNRQIDLDGYWVVGLTELSIAYSNSSKRIDDIYVYSNICTNSFVGSVEKPLLRKVHISRETTEQYTVNKQKQYKTDLIFNVPYYVPIRVGALNQIHIYITDEKGEPSSFINKSTSVTLHLKKYPFLQ